MIRAVLDGEPIRGAWFNRTLERVRNESDLRDMNRKVEDQP
jgi:hypothetical protein